MAKIDTLNNYIFQCEKCIEENNLKRAEELQDEIIGVYSKEIQNIYDNLDNYAPYATVLGAPARQVDFIGDIKKIKSKLINYRDNFELEMMKNSSKAVQNKQPYINISNVNDNNNNSSANASSSINFTVEQAINNIQSLPDDVLTSEEKEILEDKLSAIEMALKKKDKEKISSKIGSALKFVAEKGVEVGIAVLPYLGDVAKYLPALM